MPALRPRARAEHARWWRASAGTTCSRSARSRVARNPSEFDLDRLALRGARPGGAGSRATVSARREDLVGVTYHDPDGELAYCYNTEVADMRLEVFERDGRRGAWRKVDELRSDGRAHFEYAQRDADRGRRAEDP